MGGLLKKRPKFKAPEYKLYEGDVYTKRQEANVDKYGDWIDNNWESAVTAPNIEDYYQYVKDVNKPAYDQFLEDYNTQANAIAARNYNRFGGLRNTPASYTQDIYNKQMNDLAVKGAASMLGQAQGMKNQDWANEMTALGNVYKMYQDAGSTTTGLGLYNNVIQNKQEDANTAIYNYNQRNPKPGVLDYITGVIGGSSTGAMEGFSATGSPWGAIGGAIAGGIGGAADTYSGTGNQYTQGLLGPFSAMNSLKSGIGGMNLGNKGGSLFGGLFN